MLELELLQRKRIDHHGKHFGFKVDGAYEVFPHAVQEPHPPIFLAGATERSIGTAARMGLGLFLSSWTPFDELGGASAPTARCWRRRRRACAPIRRGAMWTWRAGSRRDRRHGESDSEASIMRNLAHFGSGHASGYLGTVGATIARLRHARYPRHCSTRIAGDRIGKIEELQAKAHDASLMLHFPAPVRRGQGAGLARNVCCRSDAEIPQNARAGGARERTGGRFFAKTGSIA